MKKIKLILIAVLLIAGGFFFYKQSEFFAPRSENQYQYDLAILNKSFKRDLERSALLYQSYEKYFLNYENTPFFVVVPLADLDLFKQRFDDLKDQNAIKKLPEFLTEQDVLKTCGEPDITYNGSWTQQVIKLCFGMTNIAKHYIMIDSDNYFTKNFDPKVLFEGGTFKTFGWKLPESLVEQYKTYKMNHFIDKLYLGDTTAYNNYVLVKDFFGNNNEGLFAKYKGFYAFVASPFYFNSDVIHRMRGFIDKKGGYNFAMLITIVPFEMQWYGEYVLQHEKYIQYPGMFKLVSSPDECVPEDGGDNVYGLWYQSLIYDYENHGPAAENTQLIYKRPAHCDKK